MPTKQETFDAVVAHLRKQGRKAIGANGKCVYRAQDGCKCAAGWLIPDSLYTPKLEGLSVYDDRLKAIICSEGHDWNLVWSLQAVHDGYFPEMWESRFALVAREYDLTYTPPCPATSAPQPATASPPPSTDPTPSTPVAS